MIRTYTKTISGEYTELDTNFMKELLKEKDIEFFHVELTINKVEYKIVNIPVVILNEYDEYALYKYFKKILLEINHDSSKMFDYSKWLEQDI